FLITVPAGSGWRSGEGDGDATPPSPAAPPTPCPNVEVCSCGAWWMGWLTWGANSAIGVMLDCELIRAIVTTSTRTARPAPALTRPGLREARTERRSSSFATRLRPG